MNNECLKLRNHSSGNQSDAEIQSIVMQAIGQTHKEEDEDLCDDVMVRPFEILGLEAETLYVYYTNILDSRRWEMILLAPWTSAVNSELPFKYKQYWYEWYVLSIYHLS